MVGPREPPARSPARETFGEFPGLRGGTSRAPCCLWGWGKVGLGRAGGAVGFEEVHLAYRDQAPVLCGVSFRFEDRSHNCVVGRTGAGNSPASQWWSLRTAPWWRSPTRTRSVARTRTCSARSTYTRWALLAAQSPQYLSV